MRRLKNKSTAMIVGVLVVLVGAGAAFAYWTAGGSGTGTAATGTNATLVVNQTSTPAGMGPGVAAKTLSGNFDNGNDAPTYVGSVTAAITGVSGGDGACSADDYSLLNATMNVDTQVPVGTGVGSWSGATIAFKNSATVNQDGCKNATVALGYTVSTTPTP